MNKMYSFIPCSRSFCNYIKQTSSVHTIHFSHLITVTFYYDKYANCIQLFWCQRCGVSFSHAAISDFIPELTKINLHTNYQSICSISCVEHQKLALNIYNLKQICPVY